MQLKDFIGIPYVNGGRDMAGADCWGLVMMVSRELYGKELPDYQGYANSCDSAQVAPLFDARQHWQALTIDHADPGDVIVLKLAGYPVHAGIYVEEQKMIHTLQGCNSCMIRIDRLTNWWHRIEGAYRWKGNC